MPTWPSRIFIAVFINKAHLLAVTFSHIPQALHFHCSGIQFNFFTTNVTVKELSIRKPVTPRTYAITETGPVHKNKQVRLQFG